MKINLSNAFLNATFDTLGAELLSLQDASGCERIWSGDPAYWSGHSPILFPIIGSLNNGYTTIQGTPYTMGNHGFARRSDFAIHSQTDTSVVFELNGNPVTLSQYPFNFQLQIHYWLDDHTLHTAYKITNNDNQSMPFQLGTHPAFCYDFDMANQLSDWRLEFDQPEVFHSLCIANNLIDYKSVKQISFPGTTLPLSNALFQEGALIFEHLHSSQVTLKSALTSKSVQLNYANLPHMGIWQPVGAPFICIEPWQGMGDPIGYEGTFEDKPHMITLPPNTHFLAQLSLTFTS